MRRPLVAGNWKMNGSKAGVKRLVEELKEGLGEIRATEIVVCPPFVYLDIVELLLTQTDIALGAQNLCQVPDSGAFTGEISGMMLKDLGCSYVIVGHSERRNVYGESDSLVAQRFKAARDVQMIPILCVGELLEEREGGQTEAVVGRQLDAVLGMEDGVRMLENAVIAYEPVWAIGTGMTASPEQAQQVHAYIRQRISTHDKGIAQKIRILYGGSVNAENSSELFGMEDIDGGLIGGASLKAADFLRICQAADRMVQ